jgi:hypothetical protein
MKKVIVRLAGGLGNQLFQYANGLEIAKNLEAELILDVSFLQDPSSTATSRNLELDYFQFPVSYELVRDPISFNRSPVLRKFERFEVLAKRHIRTRTFEYRVERDFHYGNYPRPKANNVYVQGYWQSPRYFPKVARELGEFIKLSETLYKSSGAFQRVIESEDCLALQVRRGDYLGNQAKNFHGLLSTDFYRRAVKHVTEKFPVTQVLIFSDDPGWAGEHLDLHPNQTIVPADYGHGRPAAHLLLMSHCRYFVLSNSTFGWWAAWLAGRDAEEVVIPSRWFADPRISERDLIPPEWTRLSN